MAKPEFECMRFYIGYNPKLSAYLQTALFELGYKWNSGHSEEPLYTQQRDVYIFTKEDGRIWKRRGIKGASPQEWRHSEAREVKLKDIVEESEYDIEIEKEYEAELAKRKEEEDARVSKKGMEDGKV